MNSKEPEMMRMRWRADRAVSCLGALLGLLASSASLGECGYEITAIIFGPDCGYELANIAPRDLNDEGHIAGHYSCPAGLESPFFWTPETGLIKIGFPPGSNGGRGYGINDSDVVVGYMNTSGWDRYAFRWEAGSLSLLPPGEDGKYCQANGVDNKGRAVGSRDYEERWGFIWDGEIVTDIVPTYGTTAIANDINDHGVVTGWMGPNVTLSHAFLWENGETKDLGTLPRGIKAEGEAVNSLNQVAGYSAVEAEETIRVLAFLWADGRMRQIGTAPGMTHSRATDMNDAGRIVGWSFDDSGEEVPFVWGNGLMRDLNQMVEPESDVDLTYAYAINNEGQIAVKGLIGWDSVAILLTPTEAAPGDVNCDAVVDAQDLLMLLSAWGPCMGCDADIDGDQTVGVADLLMLLTHWG